jgi:HEAT repeat protein
MTRAGKVLLAAGLLLVAATSVFIHCLQGGSVGEKFSLEPKYEGHTITYWMQNWRQNSWDAAPKAETQAALQSMGSEAVPYLLEWMSPKPNYGFQMNYSERALEAFKILGPKAKSAIPTLIERIGDNSGYPMRALEAIGPEAVPALSAKLRETLADKSEPVMNWRDRRYKTNFFHIQIVILQCLSEMGTNAESAIPVLLETLHVNHNWRLYQGPYETLVNVGQNHPEIVIPALLNELTNSASVINRGAIASALAMCGTNYAVVFEPALIWTINDRNTDDASRRMASEALGAAGGHSSEAIMALIQAFTNTPADYQDGIAEALGNLGSAARPALPLLLEATRSKNFNLRKNAAIAAKKIVPEETNALVRLIADVKLREFRQQAISALASLGTNAEEAVPVLLECLSQPDMQARIDATRALNAIGVTSDEFMVALGENLACTNSLMAQEAQETLSRLVGKSPLVFAILMRKGLSPADVSREIRLDAKSSLVKVAQENPNLLKPFVRDQDPNVRYAALSVFYDFQFRIPAAVPILTEIKTNDPDPRVRTIAGDVLRRQTPP